jgi:hypothetical protein
MVADDLREHFEHADGLGRVEPMGLRVDGAKRAEKGAVREPDRDRDVALKSVYRGRAVRAERGIFGDMVDDDGVAALADFMADRSPDLEFAARLDERLRLSILPTQRWLIGDFKGRAVLRSGFAVIVDAGGGDIRGAEPFLDLGDVSLVVERVCGGRLAERMGRSRNRAARNTAGPACRPRQASAPFRAGRCGCSG